MGVAAFESQFVYEDAWQGVFYVGIPTVVASALTPTVDRALGGHLTPNRASLLALFCELVVIVILTLAGLITFLSGFGQRFVIDALLMSLASIFAFRLLVVMAVSRHSLLVAAIPASIQTVAAAVLLSIYSGTTGLLLDNPLLRELLSRPEEAPPNCSPSAPRNSDCSASCASSTPAPSGSSWSSSTGRGAPVSASRCWTSSRGSSATSPKGPGNWRTSSRNSARTPSSR